MYHVISNWLLLAVAIVIYSRGLRDHDLTRLCSSLAFLGIYRGMSTGAKITMIVPGLPGIIIMTVVAIGFCFFTISFWRKAFAYNKVYCILGVVLLSLYWLIEAAFYLTGMMNIFVLLFMYVQPSIVVVLLIFSFLFKNVSGRYVA